MVRVHDGVAEKFTTTVTGDEASCDSDVFSTYALTYEDTKATQNHDTGDNIFIHVSVLTISILGVAIILILKRVIFK